MKQLRKILLGLWYYIWGHLFAVIMYDKKYLKGRWFSGKMNGLCSPGWKWVVHDGWQRFFSDKNKDARFPVSQDCRVLCPQNIEFDVDDLNNFQGSGIYYQALGKIHLGKGTYIGPNVGLITSNHVIGNLDEHTIPKPIYIGERCWIGMNSVVLPGVELGDNTIVGACSVVTKSFKEGDCVIAGNPAKKIKSLEKRI